MQYHYLSHCGLQLSKVSLGTYYSFGDRIDLNESKNIIAQSLDVGINFIDTANNYAAGRAEEVLGNALQGVHRSQYCLATKVYFPIFAGPNGAGLSKKHIVESVNQSLQRLKCDYIDILQLHRFDPNTPLEEIAETIAMLKQQGKILYMGTSMWQPEQLQGLIDIGCRSVLNQLPFSLLYQDHLNYALELERIGVSAVIYGALAQGCFSKAYLNQSQSELSRLNHHQAAKELYHNNDKDLSKVSYINKKCEKHGISLFEFALKYTDLKCKPASILLGAYQPSHIDNIASYFRRDQQISASFDEVIKEIQSETSDL